MSIKSVLFIHPSLGLGGAEKIIAFLANNFSDRYNVSFLTLKDTKSTLALKEGIKVYCEPYYSEKPILGKHMKDGISDLFKMSRAIKTIADQVEADLVVCFDLRVLLAVSLAKINAKILFSERADPYENPKYWSIILKSIYKKIDYIVFQTDEAKAFYGKIVSDKSTVIPNPALMRLNESTHREKSSVQNYIFAAGRLQYRKGFDLLIQAFSKVAKNHPDVTLRIYGNGEEKDKLLNLITELHAENVITILDPINGVVEKNINARLFVIPSRSEGIPNILIESMVAGIPCVATDCSPGGAKLISNDGEYCLLAKNNDIDSLSDCIEIALSDPMRMDKMAEHALIGINRFDSASIAKQWIKVVDVM